MFKTEASQKTMGWARRNHASKRLLMDAGLPPFAGTRWLQAGGGGGGGGQGGALSKPYPAVIGGGGGGDVTMGTAGGPVALA